MLITLKNFTAFVFLTGFSSQVFAFEFSGYLRSGVGGASGAVDQQCFEAPGVGFKFRLGNECETYGELGFAHLQDDAQSKAKFRTQVRLSLVSQTEKDWESTRYNKNTDNSDFTLALREAYVEAINALPFEANLWIGKRFYRRRDIHMIDYYYLNNSGPGAGIDSIPVANTKVSLAVTRNIRDPQNEEESSLGPTARTNYDLRWHDVDVGIGKASVVFNHSVTSPYGTDAGKKTKESLSGNMVSLLWDHSLLNVSPESAFNATLFVQRGYGLFGGLSGNSGLGDFSCCLLVSHKDASGGLKNALKNSIATQIGYHGAGSVTDTLTAEFVLMHRRVEFGNNNSPDQRVNAFGARLAQKLTPTFGLLAELGSVFTDKTAETSGGTYEDANLDKATIGAFVSPEKSGYFGRPQLRVFASMFKWNEETNDSYASEGFGEKDRAITYGAQIESWW